MDGEGTIEKKFLLLLLVFASIQHSLMGEFFLSLPSLFFLFHILCSFFAFPVLFSFFNEMA
jgi:hypothetical protein